MIVNSIHSSESKKHNSRFPLVAIIILNWNGRDDTLACLDSLSRLMYPAYRVVVVDNGSEDDSVAAIRTAYPQVTLIEAGDNLGFVGGNNLGLEQARTWNAKYALLLNNDTIADPDSLRLLVETAEEDSSIGIVGPSVYYFDHPDVLWTAGGSIDWERGDSRMIGVGEVDHGQYGVKPRQVDFISGCALLIKMSLVESVGPLDPRFFAYYEETEWCVRISRSGYKIFHVPGARIWHKISLKAREASIAVNYYMIRNRLLFLKLTGAGFKPWFNTLFLEYATRLVSWTVKPKWRHKAPHRRAMVQAIVDYGLGRFGRWNP
jgi:GT2 family glycosyltransferase